MVLVVNNGCSCDPLRAEALISRQPGVVGATVWQGKGGKLLSRVVMSDDCTIDGGDLQKLCLKQLGQSHTPVMVVVEYVKRIAA